MSEDKKPGFWGKLFGRDANKQNVGTLNPAENLETAADVAAEDGAHDVAPPEMQAEWVDAGSVNPPVATEVVPEEIHNPLDKPAGLKLPTEDDVVDAEALIVDATGNNDVSDVSAVESAEPVITNIVKEAEASVASAAEAVVDAIEEDIPAAVTPAVELAVTEKPRSWFERLSSGLKRSSDNLTSSISSIFTKKKLDNATLQDLEDTLIGADLGIDTALAITEKLRAEKFDKDVSGHDVRLAMADEIVRVLEPVARPLVIDASKKPYVILMIGVNGSGKTTSIGKLTAKLKAEGKTVLLAAGDTFRAAAVEQLQVWGQRNDVDVVTRPTGADASGLAFDALQRARAENTDVLIIDTAGRLQNRTELMDELEKIIRVIKKIDAEAPHATILTLDATTGQNALNQAEIFGKKAGVTGLIMTKLDGTARGGILVAIARKFNLPVHFIGVGESIGDLEPFRADDFAKVISGLDGDK